MTAPARITVAERALLRHEAESVTAALPPAARRRLLREWGDTFPQQPREDGMWACDAHGWRRLEEPAVYPDKSPTEEARDSMSMLAWVVVAAGLFYGALAVALGVAWIGGLAARASAIWGL